MMSTFGGTTRRSGDIPAAVQLGWRRVIPLAAVMAFTAILSLAQVSVRSLPPAVLVESTGTVALRGQVLGTLPGETGAVTWSINDVSLSSSTNVSFSPEAGPPGVPVILKATSVFDPSKFAAVPVVPVQAATLAQIEFPEAVTYHPATGKIYVASLVANGTNVDTKILEISPGGGQTQVTTFSSEIIDKLLPYTSGGTSYLLAFGLVNGSVQALNLGTKTSRRVVGGLQTPVSGAFHPASGDLYIAEQNARRVSVVSRSALDSAITGGSEASSQPLPITIPAISGVAFLADQKTRKISLLASANSGALHRLNLDDDTFITVATGLQVAQELLVMESPTLGFSFVLTGSSFASGGQIIDGAGKVSVLLPLGEQEPFSPAYAMAAGLDSLSDVAFVPAGSPYSSHGGSLILASSSSPTANRGKIVFWEPDELVQPNLFEVKDRVQPSTTWVSPEAGSVVAPGSPIEIRWRITDSSPLNSSNAYPPGLTEVLVSTDGGNSFVQTGPAYLASGPLNNEYRVIWQVPSNLAGSAIRIRIQTETLGASTQASSGDITVLSAAQALPAALFLKPNYAVAGESAQVTVDGLNFADQTGLNLGENVAVASVTKLSASRLEADISVPALASPGARTVFTCNGDTLCSTATKPFFVLSPSSPRIDGIFPENGAPGASVGIKGNNFSPLPENNVVRFGSFVATVSFAQLDALIVQVPFGVNWGNLPLSVETNGLASNTADFTITPSGFSFPSINPDGIVNGASFAPGTTPLAAGSIGSVFGSRLFPSIAAAEAVPLPRELLGVSLLLGGIRAPLFFAAPDQLNFQLPEELRDLTSAPATVFANGLPGNTMLLNLKARSPGIFSIDSSGSGRGAVLNQDGTLNGPSNPEHIGRVLQVFVTGLGATNPPVATGAGAPREPLATYSSPPQATIDGKPATVIFAGRAPDFVGLDQVNVTIPEGVSTGSPVSLILTTGGTESNTVTVSIAP